MSDNLQFDASEITDWAVAMATVPDRLQSELVRTTNALSAEGSGIAGDLAPRRDGILAGSIVPEAAAFAGDAVQGGWGTGVIYAMQKEKGGEILPRKGKFLVFPGRDGKLVFARRVSQGPQPFMAPSADRIRTRLKPAYSAAVKRALRAAGARS